MRHPVCDCSSVGPTEFTASKQGKAFRSFWSSVSHLLHERALTDVQSSVSGQLFPLLVALVYAEKAHFSIKRVIDPVKNFNKQTSDLSEALEAVKDGLYKLARSKSKWNPDEVLFLEQTRLFASYRKKIVDIFDANLIPFDREADIEAAFEALNDLEVYENDKRLAMTPIGIELPIIRLQFASLNHISHWEFQPSVKCQTQSRSKLKKWIPEIEAAKKTEAETLQVEASRLTSIFKFGKAPPELPAKPFFIAWLEKVSDWINNKIGLYMDSTFKSFVPEDAYKESKVKLVIDYVGRFKEFQRECEAVVGIYVLFEANAGDQISFAFSTSGSPRPGWPNEGLETEMWPVLTRMLRNQRPDLEARDRVITQYDLNVSNAYYILNTKAVLGTIEDSGTL